MQLKLVTKGVEFLYTLFKEIEKDKIILHKPHPRKEPFEPQIKQIVEHLEQEGLI